MPLKYTAAPPGAAAALAAGLSALSAAQKARPDGGGRLAVSAQPDLLGPLPIYNLAAADLAAGHGAERAVLGGWRYLVMSGAEASRATELSAGADGSARFYGVTAGASVAATPGALALAAGLAGDYEPRSLRVPGLAGQALWLHRAADPTADRFILLPLVFKPLELGRAYTAAELMPLLRDKAARVGPRGAS